MVVGSSSLSGGAMSRELVLVERSAGWTTNHGGCFVPLLGEGGWR
jgi:hypothetical protein